MSRVVNKNMDNLKNIAINIKKLRNTLNLTQSEFSMLLGVKQSYISRIENGEKIPNVKLIMKIANVFEVTTDSLLMQQQAS